MPPMPPCRRGGRSSSGSQTGKLPVCHCQRTMIDPGGWSGRDPRWLELMILELERKTTVDKNAIATLTAIGPGWVYRRRIDRGLQYVLSIECTPWNIFCRSGG
jgi:hypothetical protein